MRLYVAGQVVEPGKITVIYSDLLVISEEFGVNIELPVRDPFLDRLNPPEFSRATFDRISEVDAVVTVLTAGDQSASVEATFAALRGKPQLLIRGSSKYEIPRMLSGLPNVQGVIRPEQIPTELPSFIRSIGVPA